MHSVDFDPITEHPTLADRADVSLLLPSALTVSACKKTRRSDAVEWVGGVDFPVSADSLRPMNAYISGGSGGNEADRLLGILMQLQGV